MSIFIYRKKPSTGAQDLAEALDGIRFRARQRPIERAVKNGDVVVCWGEEFTAPAGVRVLNGAPIRSKYQDAIRLSEAGVPTIKVSQTRPTPRVVPAAPDPAVAQWQALVELLADFPIEPANIDLRSPVTRDALLALGTAVTRTRTALEKPAPQPVQEDPGTWLPRMNNHVGGNDLLQPPDRIDYWSKKENIVREFRIHSFNKKSIRAGVKDLREGFTLPTNPAARIGNGVAHPWIRSWDGGWRIKYDGVTSKQRHRDLAHAAVEALGLQFGAVDIGELDNGSLIVLEVNRAPGLEGGTIDAYANAINNWINTPAA